MYIWGKKKIIYSRLKILKNGVRRGGEHLSDNEIVMILASITELGETLDQVEANDEDGMLFVFCSHLAYFGRSLIANLQW